MPPSFKHSDPSMRDKRQQVIERDHGICQYCGDPGHQFDLKRPPNHGGLPTIDNMVCCCNLCLRVSNDAPYPTFADKKKYILSKRHTTLNRETIKPTNIAHRVPGVYSRVPLADQKVITPISPFKQKLIDLAQSDEMH